MPEEFVDRGCDLKTIEGVVRNKFKWFWLEEKDNNGDFLSDYIRKIREPGFAYCLYCKQRLNYGSKGKSFITRHALSKHHIIRRNEVKDNQSLPACFHTVRSLEEGISPADPVQSTSTPYGLAPNVANTASGHAVPQPPIDKLPAAPNIKDRKAHQEAIICSFIAEHSLPLAMAPKLIGLAQLLSRDYKALQGLSMERQTATYKLKYGLSALLRKRIIQKLRNNFFSLNIDESTTKHGKKRILNILVCYFDFDLGKSVTQLYCSVELFTVNSETVFNAVMEVLNNDKIPLSNLISVLSDSAAYMRGKINGFFAKLRRVAPHVIDIDADACHHIHNISKSFSSSVDPNNHISKLMDDIFKDLEYSADIREQFTILCDLLNVKPLLPKERAGHRWLSLFDCCERFNELKDVLSVFYFSWLSQADKELFDIMVTDIFKARKVKKEDRKKVYAILSKLKSKNLTDFGKARKQRICLKLFDFERKTSLLVCIVLSVFPIFKRFVLLFERKTPMLHVLHDELVDVFRSFLQFFVQPEFIRESGKELYSFDLSRNDILLPAKHVFVGSCCNVLLEMDDVDVMSFRSGLLDTYLSTAKYMQNKLPLNNSLLRTFSFLDPQIFGRGVTAISLKKLPEFLPTVIVGNFDDEIMKMQSDMDICASDCELDLWWAKVFKLNRYSSVTKVVSACLSVFTGPRVEQSFSLMNSVISENRSSLLVSTYEAYMFPKYHLLSVNKSTLQFYERKDPITSPVDASLAYHMQNASNTMNRINKREAGDQSGEPPPAKKRK